MNTITRSPAADAALTVRNTWALLPPLGNLDAIPPGQIFRNEEIGQHPRLPAGCAERTRVLGRHGKVAGLVQRMVEAESVTMP